MTLERKREKIADILVKVSREARVDNELMLDQVEAICLSVDEAKLACCREEDLLLILFLHLDRIYRDSVYAEEVKIDAFVQIGLMLDYVRERLLERMGR